MRLFEIIRSAGQGAIVAQLAAEAGVDRSAAEAGMRRAWRRAIFS